MNTARAQCPLPKSAPNDRMGMLKWTTSVRDVLRILVHTHRCAFQPFVATSSAIQPFRPGILEIPQQVRKATWNHN
jgi:hypothetical protein